ncbi:ABC transporter ATP-binding protein [Corynebacterium sp. 335C]
MQNGRRLDCPIVTTDTSPALRLTGATKRYGGVAAVDGLDLELRRGRVLALLGPNGAGKTTTIEMCEGFVRPDEGSVEVLGMNPWRDAARLRRRIGIMLQGGGAYPGIRVGEMLDLVASYAANPMDADWLLGVVGLSRHRRTSYKRLSGGQQQRLSLACALVGRPELVFLDEPTAGLDAQSRIAVWDLVSSLRRDGATVVLTTHFMDEAEALADDVLIIDRGRAVAAGTPSELTGLETSRGVDLSTETPVDAARLARELGPGVTVTETAPEHYRVTGAGEPDDIARLAAWCAAERTLITELRVAHRSLEDVFLDITGREMRS